MRDQVETAQPKPVAADQRIVTLDVLRGAAVLGILAVNAAAFALPMMAIEMTSGQSPFPAEANASGVAQWIIAVFFRQKGGGVEDALPSHGVYCTVWTVQTPTRFFGHLVFRPIGYLLPNDRKTK